MYTTNHLHRICLDISGYDVVLRDALYWPAALLDDILHIPSVDVLILAPLQPQFGKAFSIPNPLAYVPQLGSGLMANMVSNTGH